MPKIGAHVSAAVSLERSFLKAQEIGAEATQIFISPPRQWLQVEHSEEVIKRFREKEIESGITPTFIHGTYLINLGSGSEEHLNKSTDWLIWALNMASLLHSRGVIFHMGSHKGRGFEAVKAQVVESLTKILAGANNNSFLILENPVATGGNLGSSLQELGWILKQVQDDRLKICLDTQHAFASGYDLKTPIGLKDFVEEFEAEIGMHNLVAVHANDSKVEFKSLRDRHENIGEGFIGEEGFKNILNHPIFENVPFILEVPGFSGGGPDKENVERLKCLKS